MTWAQTSAFYHQLRSILHTGLTLEDALPLAVGRGLGRYSERAKVWAAACGSGSTWHEQLRADGEPPLASALVQAGEQSGRLDEMCVEIAAFYDHLIEVRRMVISRSIYPVVLLHAALTIPTLPGIILGQAPLWTFVLGPLVLWALVAVAIAVGFALKRSGALARLALWPFVRALTDQLAVANTCLVTRAGLAAGMLMHESLGLAAGACGNRIWGARIQQQADAIFQGCCPDLTTALRQAGFPEDILQIVHGSEVSGELETGLQRAATIGRERFRARVTWTFKVLMGILYGVAIAYAAFTILSMFMQVYIDPMREALEY